MRGSDRTLCCSCAIFIGFDVRNEAYFSVKTVDALGFDFHLLY